MEGCKGCKYWDIFTWACSNADSPHCADFVSDGCKYYQKDDKNEQFKD